MMNRETFTSQTKQIREYLSSGYLFKSAPLSGQLYDITSPYQYSFVTIMIFLLLILTAKSLEVWLAKHFICGDTDVDGVVTQRRKQEEEEQDEDDDDDDSSDEEEEEEEEEEDPLFNDLQFVTHRAVVCHFLQCLLTAITLILTILGGATQFLVDDSHQISHKELNLIQMAVQAVLVADIFEAMYRPSLGSATWLYKVIKFSFFQVIMLNIHTSNDLAVLNHLRAVVPILLMNVLDVSTFIALTVFRLQFLQLAKRILYYVGGPFLVLKSLCVVWSLILRFSFNDDDVLVSNQSYFFVLFWRYLFVPFVCTMYLCDVVVYAVLVQVFSHLQMEEEEEYYGKTEKKTPGLNDPKRRSSRASIQMMQGESFSTIARRFSNVSVGSKELDINYRINMPYAS
jgi:hypothetical protein